MTNSSTNYYDRQADIDAARQKSMLTLLFLALGLGIGTAIAAMLVQKSHQKPRTVGTVAEEALNNGREAIAPTLKRLEKEFAELRKSIDHKVHELRH